MAVCLDKGLVSCDSCYFNAIKYGNSKVHASHEVVSDSLCLGFLSVMLKEGLFGTRDLGMQPPIL